MKRQVTVREKPTRADTNDFRAKGLENVDLFDGDIVRHDDTALVASTKRSTNQWTSLSGLLRRNRVPTLHDPLSLWISQ